MNATLPSFEAPHAEPATRSAGKHLRAGAVGRAPATVRYGMVWEDADVLIEALRIAPGDRCLSIASAGDNVLAMLAQQPGEVLAIDSSAPQLACLDLRVAAFASLAHGELLELIGSRRSRRRPSLYRRCRAACSPMTRRFFDARPRMIARGIGHGGRFERYLAAFRHLLLPLVHRRGTVRALFEPRSATARSAFHDEVWNTPAWRGVIRLAGSEALVGRFAREQTFFRYAEGSLAMHLAARIRHALVDLEPASNPYLHFILHGEHGDVLPYALRREHFDAIRNGLGRLQVRHASLEQVLRDDAGLPFDRFNLSDVFEYMSPAAYHGVLGQIVARARPGARLAYWNMLATRRRPPELAGVLAEDRAAALRLHQRDRAFFYRDFVIEEVR